MPTMTSATIISTSVNPARCVFVGPPDRELFDPASDPDDVFVSFRRSKVCDHSAIEAIHAVSEKYRALGKRLHITHLDVACSKVLEKAGDIVEQQYYATVPSGHS